MHKLREWMKYLLPFIVAMLLFAFITQYEQTVFMLKTIWETVKYLLGRFFIGFGLAYFLNFIVRFFERRFKFRRWMSLTATYVIFVGFLAAMGWIVVPALTDSVKAITSSFGNYYTRVRELTDGLLVNLPPDTAAVIDDSMKNVTDAVIGYMQQLLSINFVGATLGGATRSFANLAFGLIISVYALWDKENLKAGAKRVLYAFAPSRAGDFTLRVSRDADANFSKFIIGKIWDSTIIGLLALILFMLFRLPAVPFLTLVVAVTNMIPYFGPFMGGVICGVALLGFDPVQCLIGVIIIIVLQALDGMVIGPKILGDAVGISPLLTVIAITVGGDLFGLMGILMGVPVAGTLKKVVIEKLINDRLAARGLGPNAELAGQMRMDE